MLIAVIADTHDLVPRHVPRLLQGADEIWHLGDVIAPNILAELNPANRPLKIVSGNCDYDPSWPLTLTLTVEKLRCHLVHIPPSRPPADIRVILHGHTHVPRDYTDHMGCRWLNPGSVTKPRGGFKASFAWLEIKDGQIRRWDIVPV